MLTKKELAEKLNVVFQLLTDCLRTESPEFISVEPFDSIMTKLYDG